MKDINDLAKKIDEQQEMLKLLIAEIRYMQVITEARYLNRKTKELLDEASKTES